LPIVLAAKAWGVQHVVLPAAGSEEVAHVEGISLHTACSLSEVRAYLEGRADLGGPAPVTEDPYAQERWDSVLEHAQTYPGALRALQIAAAGGHPALLVGMGSCTMHRIQRMLPDLLPTPTPQQLESASCVHSVAGLLSQHTP